jgi:hypothetical protein
MKWKENGEKRPSGASIGTSLKWDRRTIPYLVCGKIHPILHEWLMGWPIMWTDLCEQETGKFQQWLGKHGLLCAKERSEIKKTPVLGVENVAHITRNYE